MPISDDPEKRKLVEAIGAEWLKLCDQRGLDPEQIIQAAIVVGMAALELEADGDKKYLLELVERVEVSFRSAVKVALKR